MLFRSLAAPADEPCTYLCGNSLGLLPKRAKKLVQEELDVWATRYAARFPPRASPRAQKRGGSGGRLGQDQGQGVRADR